MEVHVRRAWQRYARAVPSRAVRVWTRLRTETRGEDDEEGNVEEAEHAGEVEEPTGGLADAVFKCPLRQPERAADCRPRAIDAERLRAQRCPSGRARAERDCVGGCTRRGGRRGGSASTRGPRRYRSAQQGLRRRRE